MIRVILKLFKNIIKIIHRLVYCLLLPVGIVLYLFSNILYYLIMMFVPIIFYIFKGDFYTECINDIEDEDYIVNKIFIKFHDFIYPKYK